MPPAALPLLASDQRAALRRDAIGIEFFLDGIPPLVIARQRLADLFCRIRFITVPQQGEVALLEGPVALLEMPGVHGLLRLRVVWIELAEDLRLAEMPLFHSPAEGGPAVVDYQTLCYQGFFCLSGADGPLDGQIPLAHHRDGFEHATRAEGFPDG